MIKLRHCHQALLLCGGLITPLLHASQHKSQDDFKYQEEAPSSSTKSFYTYGDLTFFQQERDNVNQEELKQGLIDLSQRIRAKQNRKVYFFFGATNAGKSLSIAALQGNKIKKRQEYTDSDASFGDSDEDTSSPTAQLEVAQYVLPKKETPAVGDSCTVATKSTYIYYPHPKKQKYAAIAFADTEGFLGKRKATSAQKCLSSISLFYAAKVNKIGGLVLVISASTLEVNRREGLMHIAHMLQQYFPKAMSQGRIAPSLLIMITKVDHKSSREEAKRKIRSLIQLFYQEYYAEASHASYPFSEIKKQDDNRCLKQFFSMLLVHDVPKDQIDDINKFKLDKNRFCFIFPWREKSLRKILDHKLANLKPIPPRDLATFDNPLSQYIRYSILQFSSQLYTATQPLLALKHNIDQIEKQIATVKNKQALDECIAALEKEISYWHHLQSAIQSDTTLEVVFSQLHYESLPIVRGDLARKIEIMRAFKLCKLFQYHGKAPIYKIEATYGPQAHLSESNPACKLFQVVPQKVNFIEKHFITTIVKHKSGTSTWKAVAKHGKGVKKDQWLLYHITTGEYNAACNIKFYALRKERIAAQTLITYAKARIKSLEKDINYCKVTRDNYNNFNNTINQLSDNFNTDLHKLNHAWGQLHNMLHSGNNNHLGKGVDQLNSMLARLDTNVSNGLSTLSTNLHVDFSSHLKNTSQKLAQAFKNKQTVQIKKWKGTAHMLQFFVTEILAKGAEKDLIKQHLADFQEATQLQSFVPIADPNHKQQEKPQQEENTHSSHSTPPPANADHHRPNDHQFPDDDYMLDTDE